MDRTLELSSTGSGDDCELVDFSIHLEKLGELLNTLETDFKLAQKPLAESIRTYVNAARSVSLPYPVMVETISMPKMSEPQTQDGATPLRKCCFWEKLFLITTAKSKSYLPDDAARELPFTY